MKCREENTILRAFLFFSPFSHFPYSFVLPVDLCTGSRPNTTDVDTRPASVDSGPRPTTVDLTYHQTCPGDPSARFNPGDQGSRLNPHGIRHQASPFKPKHQACPPADLGTRTPTAPPDDPPRISR